MIEKVLICKKCKTPIVSGCQLLGSEKISYACPKCDAWVYDVEKKEPRGCASLHIDNNEWDFSKVPSLEGTYPDLVHKGLIEKGWEDTTDIRPKDKIIIDSVSVKEVKKHKLLFECEGIDVTPEFLERIKKAINKELTVVNIEKHS